MVEKKDNVMIQISVTQDEYWKLAQQKGTKRSWYDFFVTEKL